MTSDDSTVLLFPMKAYEVTCELRGLRFKHVVVFTCQSTSSELARRQVTAELADVLANKNFLTLCGDLVIATSAVEQARVLEVNEAA